MRWVLLAALLAAGLGGCFDRGEQQDAAPTDEETGQVPDGRDANGTDDGQDGNGTGQPPQNGTQIPSHQGLSVNVTANATNGSAPLHVTLHINVTSGRGEPVEYSLDFGDGNRTNGTIMPGERTGQDGNATGGTGGNATGDSTGGQAGGGNGSFGGQGGTHTFGTVTVDHTYGWSGPYDVTVNATQGNQTANATLAIDAEPQPEVVFEDTVLCGPGVIFVSGSISDGEHELEVQPAQSNLTVTLEYPDSLANDLDLRITAPDGTETESFEAGPEPPISFDRPMPGTWTIEVLAFSCAASEDYTVTATFA